MDNESSSEPTKKRGSWGGRRAGSGRKPLPEPSASKITTMVLTQELIDKLKKLGGSKWVRQIISDTPVKSAEGPDCAKAVLIDSTENCLLHALVSSKSENIQFCRCEEDGMQSAGVRSGDLLIIDRTRTPVENDLVVVHDGKGLSLRLYTQAEKPGGVRRKRLPDYVNELSAWRIFGTVVYLVRPSAH